MSRRAAKLNGAREAIVINDDPFFTPATLSRRWHKNIETVRRLLRRRLLASVIIGRQRLIPREAVLAFEQAGFIPQCETPGATNGGPVQ